jgi:hypothetical protein
MGEGKMRAIIGTKEIAEREIANAGQLRSWMRNGGKNSDVGNVNRRVWKSPKKRTAF